MTSAEPQRMELERAIELDRPITGLAYDEEHPERALITVYFEQGLPAVVSATTGAPYDGDDMPFGRPRLAQQSLGTSDVLVQAEGKDIVMTSVSSRVLRLTGHASAVTTLGLFPTAGVPLLMSGSGGGSIKLWNLRTGDLVSQSPECRVSVLLVLQWPDGQPRIVAGGPTGTLSIWNPRLPLSTLTGLVSTYGFSDRVAQQDLLDRGALVSALADMLQPGRAEAPTVITVEGAWGSGKSTLLELVQNRLSPPPLDVPAERRLTVFGADRRLWRPRAKARSSKDRLIPRPVVVSFNPWRHQSSEQVWAGLAKVVTEAVESAILPHQNARERYWFTRNAARVDRRHLQRQLWRRTFSPLLSLAALGFGVSVLNALTNLKFGWAWWVTAGLASAGVLHTALRYLFARASAFLPGELFAGPVVSNAFAASTTDPLLRDPYYNARAGYLYLVQHDVQALLKDLAADDHELILLIDDLDRCTPRTTAQVFEAINVFLSDDFPATRFVLGLDTTVVAAHVDNAYRELSDAKIVTHPDDPSPGWTFLRKLVQLPVRVPRATADNVDQVLLSQLGPVHREEEAAPVEKPASPGLFSLAEIATLERLNKDVIAIERHPEVREHLRRRLRAQPEQSVREEKRLLNVWQFYLRMLGTIDPAEAGDLVAVAEIATRWPAYLHRLRGSWHDLAAAAGDDVEWGATIARLGFTYSDRKPAANLRDLLGDCDRQAVADLANRLF
ncbi:P-loop NTPase fold protein [Lentzea sp. NPDC058450]|uniref:P-loop NTPase fold protein n=1 Tax=Lentzea sp. NPDC058450 TaxID=3346505 RepID=UPI003656891A